MRELLASDTCQMLLCHTFPYGENDDLSVVYEQRTLDLASNRLAPLPLSLPQSLFVKFVALKGMSVSWERV